MNSKRQKLAQQLINGLLIVLVLGLAGWLSTRYKFETDWTYGNRNTLTAASQKLLSALPDPVKFTAFDYPNSGNRDNIENWVNRYRHFKANVSVEFVDPSANPARVKAYKINAPGEVVIEYQSRRENLPGLNSEAEITAALQRMTDSGEHFVVFLEGHGERNTQPGAAPNQNDMTLFAAALQSKGLKVQPINLVATPHIPDNTSVLVIASPTQTLLDGEIKLVDDYVKAGGNLLWLTDPETPAGLDAVAKTLGIRWQNGSVIFPDAEALGLSSPAIFAAAQYPPNPVTAGFKDVTAFPLARSIGFESDPAKNGGWIAAPIVQTDERAWLETGPLEGGVQFDAGGGDIRGPLTIALSLTRERKTEGEAKPEQQLATQRVALVGDSDFLADANVTAYGNKQLGLNLVQWLASRDAQLNIDVPKAPDASLHLSAWAMRFIGVAFVLLLPAALLGFGLLRWAVRRRR